jgi:O-antigen/teichoic acid export membrane protein
MTGATSSRLTGGRAGRDIVAQLLMRTTNLVAGVVTTVVLVRALGNDGFGQWATLLAILTLAGNFGLRGLDNVAVERATAEPERSAAWAGALLTLRTALAPALALGSLAVCLAVADTAGMRVAAVIIHVTLLSTALAAAKLVFQLQVRNARVSAVELGSGLAWGLAVVAIAVLGGGLLAVALAFAAVQTAANLVLLWLSFRAHPIRLRGARQLWGPLVRLGLPVGVASLIALGYAQVAQILVFELRGDAEAGLYGAVRRIYDPVHFLPSTIMATLFPLLVAARVGGRDRLARLFNTAVDNLLLVSLPGLAIALAGAESIVVTLFGAEFAPAAPALPVLMAAFVLGCLGHLSGYLVITYGLQRRFVLVALAALVFNVAANLVLLPRYGFLAAAWVTLATEVIVLVPSMAMVCRRMGVAPTGVRIGRIAVAAAGTWAAGALLDGAGVPLVLWLPAAAAAYAVLLVALGAVRLSELRSLLGGRLGQTT